MTYGENAGALRDELAALLRHHRVQQRLGGPGIRTVPESTTVDQRAEMGRIMQRYRYLALTWCHLALESVSPKTDVHRTSADRGPVEELRRRLGKSLAAATVDGPPLLDLLAIDHEFELLVRWQRIARAAALGEHDFAADVNLGHVNPAERCTVTKDAAVVVRGLVVLDRRYQRIPGWNRLPGSAPLDRAAESVARMSSEEAGDLGVDARGWRPAPAVISGPALPGVAGAVQAQHNLLVDLAQFPNALNLRRLLHAQARVSREAARCATSAAPDLVDRFLERQGVYGILVTQCRNIGGLVGAGGLAVAESQNAIVRLQRASPDALNQEAALHELRRLFTCTDARLISTIERGFHEKLYFVSAKVPRITHQQVHGVFQLRQHWTPASSIVQTDLLPLVRERLRPPLPPQPIAPDNAQVSRKAYEAALSHRPERGRRAR